MFLHMLLYINLCDELYAFIVSSINESDTHIH